LGEQHPTDRRLHVRRDAHRDLLTHLIRCVAHHDHRAVLQDVCDAATRLNEYPAGTRELLQSGYRTPQRMLAASWQQRVDALSRAHYRRFDESTATRLDQSATWLLDTYRGESALTTWLNRVTVNAALLHRRKQSRRRERQVHTRLDILPEHERACAAVSPRTAPDQQVMDQEMQELIERAIAGLPDIYRDVYVLADVEELPNASIGEMLNLEVPAVKSRLHRARLMMREVLIPHF